MPPEGTGFTREQYNIHMWKANILLGVATTAIGVYVYADSFQNAYTAGFGPGPSFSQYWLGSGLAAVSVVYILLNLYHRLDGRGFPFTAETMLRSGGLFLLLGASTFMIEPVGFVAAMAFFMIVVLRVFEKRSWRFSLGVGLVTPLAVFLLFAVVFKVPLPKSLPILI